MVVDLAAAPIPHALVVVQPVLDETLRGLSRNQPPQEDLTVRCLLLDGEMVVDAENPDPAGNTGVVGANDLGCLEKHGERLSVEREDGSFLELRYQLPNLHGVPPFIRQVSPPASVRVESRRDRSAPPLGRVPDLAGRPCVTHHLDFEPSLAKGSRERVVGPAAHRDQDRVEASQSPLLSGRLLANVSFTFFEPEEAGLSVSLHRQ